MATGKAIFEVDFPTEKLAAFSARFKELRAQLAQSPEDFERIAAAMETLAEPLQDALTATAALGEAQAGVASQAGDASRRQAAAMAQSIRDHGALRAAVDKASASSFVSRAAPLSGARAAGVSARGASRDSAAATFTERAGALDREQRRSPGRAERFARGRPMTKPDLVGTKKSELAAGAAPGDALGDVKDFSMRVDEAGRGMHTLFQQSAGVAKNIGEATISLLKWGGVLSAVGGLLGAGGLFGIDRLAAGVMGRQKSAGGLGVTSGEQQAFGINYQNVVGSPDSLLSGIADTKNDASKSWILRALGVDPTGKDAAQLAPSVLQAIKARLKGSDPQSWQQLSDAGHWGDLGLGPDDLRRINAMSSKDLAGDASQFGRDAQTLSLPQPVQDAWTSLKKQLDRAGAQLENAFVTALAPLSKPIAALSADFASLVTALLKSPEVASGIGVLDQGLKDLATYFQSKSFGQDLKDFEADIGKLADWGRANLPTFETTLSNLLTNVGKVSDALGGVAGVLDDFNAIANPSMPASPGDVAKWNKDHPNNQVKLDPRWSQEQAPPANHWWNPGSWLNPGGLLSNLDYQPGGGMPMLSRTSYDTGGAPNASRFGSIEASNGLPAGLLDAIMMQESGGNAQAVSAAGAMGAFQFMPGTAAQYNVNPWDANSSAMGAGRMMSDLIHQFGGNLDQALASYNDGAGNVAAAIKKYGADWLSHTPQETQRYVSSVEGRMGRQPAAPATAHIVIHNRTGGSAIVSSAQMAV